MQTVPRHSRVCPLIPLPDRTWRVGGRGWSGDCPVASCHAQHSVQPCLCGPAPTLLDQATLPSLCRALKLALLPSFSFLPLTFYPARLWSTGPTFCPKLHKGPTSPAGQTPSWVVQPGDSVSFLAPCFESWISLYPRLGSNPQIPRLKKAASFLIGSG